MNYALRYLPSESKQGGEVKYLLPYTTHLNGYISYGDRDHVFDIFNKIVEKQGFWGAEKIEWVEVTYGGNLKTPNEQGIFTRVDGGQRVKKWIREAGVTEFYDPEPQPAPEPEEQPEPDDIIITDDTNTFRVHGNENNFTVTSTPNANVVIDGNLTVNGTVTVNPTEEPVLLPLDEETKQAVAGIIDAELEAGTPPEVLRERLQTVHDMVAVDAENVEVEEEIADEERATN